MARPAAGRRFADLARAALPGRGRERARFLENRCRAALIHLDAIDAFANAFAAREASTERELVQAIGSAKLARRLADDYLRKYAEIVRDRGDQGMLISYYYSLAWRSDRLAETLAARLDTLRADRRGPPPGTE